MSKSSSPQLFDNLIQGFLWIFRDITPIIGRQDEESMRAKGSYPKHKRRKLDLEVLCQVGVDGVGGVLFVSLCFSFFSSVFLLSFLISSSFSVFLCFLLILLGQKQPTAKSRKDHSNPICTDPVWNFPNQEVWKRALGKGRRRQRQWERPGDRERNQHYIRNTYFKDIVWCPLRNGCPRDKPHPSQGQNHNLTEQLLISRMWPVCPGDNLNLPQTRVQRGLLCPGHRPP